MATPKTEVRAPGAPRAGEILSPEALAFLGELHSRFNDRRLELLEARATRQKAFDWNCRQHITPRFTLAQVQSAVEPLQQRIAALEAENAALRAAPP